MKNYFLLLLVHFVSFFLPKQTSNKKKILVISTTALGDSIWATPFLESLRKSFSKSYIALLTSPIGEEALRFNPWVNETFIVKKNYVLLWKTLFRKKFDTIVILHASQRFIFPLAALLGAGKIVATAKMNKGLDSLITDLVEPSSEHEIWRRLRLLEKIGGLPHTEKLSFFLQPEEKIPSLSPGIWVALHPGSKDSFKRWPISHFIQVGKALQALGCKILITGGATENDLIQTLVQEIPGAIRSNPSYHLREFSALLQQIDLLISNDTGPVHIACALGAPVISLYSSTDPSLCGPLNVKTSHLISRPPTCFPCLKRSCKRPFCMLQIGPDEVVAAAKEKLYAVLGYI